MTVRQFEVWKCQPAGFERAHRFVIVSGSERCAAERQRLVNALACFSLRGEPSKTDVRLNGADGFDAPTVCQCDFVYVLPKDKLHDGRGSVSWERQQQIKAKLKEVWRF
jgi:mRNA-degrading endonuclease toxin of MazEF toxin-antitoxin module